MPSNRLILCQPLLHLPSMFPSISVLSNESALHIRWPKYWSFSFSISPSNEYSGLISFRIDWLDLLAVQGTPKSLFQLHTSKTSILQCSAFFMAQLSHPYTTTGKIIALTRWTFVDQIMSLLFNTLSRLVIAFLLRSKHLLISWLLSPSAVILKPKKIKSVIVSIVSPSICHEAMGPDALILVFECWILSQPFHFPLSSRGVSSSLISAIRVVSSAYLRLLIFLAAVLIPACDSSSLAFHMMYSEYKLNKQGDNIQPWHSPFPIWNQSVAPCLVLTVASWSAYRFLRKQVRWSGIPISQNFPQFVVIHTVKGFRIVIQAEVDVLLELSWFFYNPEMLAIWSLVPLHFLNPTWTSGSSWFTYCWSLAWRILSITLLACEMSAIV